MNQIEETTPVDNYKALTHCPFCSGKLIKKGIRKKKFENIQLYYCGNCKKKLSSSITKHKTYPLRVILESLTLYNRLHPLDSIPELVRERYGITITSRTVDRWVKEYEKYLPFLRMREFAANKYQQKEIIEESTFIHQQVYHFKYHRAKTDIILNEEFRHYRFRPLQQFLELVIAECPHQLFQGQASRASEFKSKFNLSGVKITPKNNAAVRTANFITQAVSNNKLRHETLQEFMLANDSVTVAVEVPVLMGADDLRHYKHELNFDIPISLNDGEHITGHIDLVQVRNGSIHVMDYKPGARKEKPIEQLTIYALALSRLTGLRLYHFRCAWFDENDYYEFFPLHIVYKPKRGKRLPRQQTQLSGQGIM